jgi:hypothetical protein
MNWTPANNVYLNQKGVLVVVQCNKHPRYQGKLFPSSGCGKCIGIYHSKHKEKKAINLHPPKMRKRTKNTECFDPISWPQPQFQGYFS